MKTPTHTCPVMGKDTEYIRAYNSKTGEKFWTCVWCQIADKMKKEL